MILQRYTFGSKSQPVKAQRLAVVCCLWYCKDIHLEANHNRQGYSSTNAKVAYDIAKIYIWKQITTALPLCGQYDGLLMILQRYTFGSKSQPYLLMIFVMPCCLWYCKDIHLEANHNSVITTFFSRVVAYDIAKIYIWKQITTQCLNLLFRNMLLMILQRYTFGSKSQHKTCH